MFPCYLSVMITDSLMDVSEIDWVHLFIYRSRITFIDPSQGKLSVVTCVSSYKKHLLLYYSLYLGVYISDIFLFRLILKFQSILLWSKIQKSTRTWWGKSIHESLDSVATLTQHHLMEEIPSLGLKWQFYMACIPWVLTPENEFARRFPSVRFT